MAAVKGGFINAENGMAQINDLLPEAITNQEVENVITYLLNHGADVNAIDNYKQTPLSYAAVKGNNEAITLLLKWPGIKPEMKDTSGATPLHNAFSNGHTQSAKILLLANAQLMTFDNSRANPLHYAAKGDGSKILQEIFYCIKMDGGYWKDWSLSKIVNDQNIDRESILHLAVSNGDYKTCKLVINEGAEVNLCRNGFVSPLHLAARSGNEDIVKLLVVSNADLEAQNEELQTPLRQAAKYNRVNVVKLLLIM